MRPGIADTILRMAAERGPAKSTCPSEIARLLFSADWRSHMPEIRDQAIALQKQGRISITQKGVPVDVNNFKGPIRIQTLSQTFRSSAGLNSTSK